MERFFVFSFAMQLQYNIFYFAELFFVIFLLFLSCLFYYLSSGDAVGEIGLEGLGGRSGWDGSLSGRNVRKLSVMKRASDSI